MAAPPAQAGHFKVDGKTAIVTGAGSGICLSFARLLLSRHCNVVFADIALRPEAQKTVDEHSSKDEGKARAVFVKCDVTIWDDLTNVFEVADAEFGGADLVCPGAGIFEPEWTNFWVPPGSSRTKDPVHGTAKEGLGHYAIFDINVTHPVRVTQLAISRWLSPPEGSNVGKASPGNPKRVVHISSIAGQLPSFATPLYAAGKHAISAFIRSMEPLQEALGVKVNGVAPGIIRTPLWTEHPEKMKMLDESVDEWVTPEEVAEQMLRCAEDDAVGAGFVWEVLKGRYRNVDYCDAPAPSGPGGTASGRAAMMSEVFGWLAEPDWGVAKQQ